MRARLAARVSRGLRAAAFGYLVTALFAATVTVLAASNPGTPLRPRPGGAPRVALLGAAGERPFAVAFHPPGPAPRWVLLACAGRVLRLPIASANAQRPAASLARQKAPRAPRARGRVAEAQMRLSQPN